MAEIFVISDTHFSHARTLEFVVPDWSYHCPHDAQQCDAACQATHPTTTMRRFPSVEAMDETMVARWNAAVPPTAHIYHLGDVTMDAAGLRFIERLSGHKRLILGNHDREDVRKYRAAGFQKVLGAREFEGVICTHYPIYAGGLTGKKPKINIHGHIHNNFRLPLPWVNVSVEEVDYTPVALDVIRQRAGLPHGG